MPTSQNEGMELASRWLRLAGAIIDGLISFAIGFGVFFLIGMNSEAIYMEDTGPFEMDFSGMTLLGVGISWGIYIAINYHFWATRGQSIGKLAVGIKIVRTDGSQASAGRIIGLRFLVMAVVSLFGLIGSIISLVDVLLIFRQEKNCLHDDIADTRVVVANPTPVSY